MASIATAGLLEAIRAEPASTTAVEHQSVLQGNGALDCCRLVLALLSQPGATNADLPVLLMVAATAPYAFPEWGHPFVNLSPFTDGVWRLKLANGQSLIFAMSNRHDDAAIRRMHSLLVHVPDISAVLVDGQLVQTWHGGKRQYNVDLPAKECHAAPVAMIHPCSYLDDARLILDQSQARQTLRVFASPDGLPAWQHLLHPPINWRELTTEENQRLGKVCLMLNQHERLILDKWTQLEQQMQHLRAQPDCWFVDYEIECPIELVLREDDPRWRENDDNLLLSWPYDGV